MVPSLDQCQVLTEQIESILDDSTAANVSLNDATTRRRLAEAARKLSVALEEPRDTLRRFGYIHYQLPLAFIGAETGIFSVLAAESRPFTNAELVDKTRVSPQLLTRLLRYYQALDMVAQVGDDSYQSNNVTRTLGDSYYANILRFSQKIMAPASLKLPEFLQQIGFEDPSGVMPTAWNVAFNTDLHPFVWFVENPWAKELGLIHMRIQREGRPLFFDALDFKERFGQGTTDSTLLFVDVGGSLGPQSIAFRQRYPDLPGRVILQDRPEVIQKAKDLLIDIATIETEAYDFFTPQIINGARAYYLRNVLHDWSDAQCVDILQNVKAGMTEHSVLLIDETALPERNSAPRAVQHDIEVLVSLGAKERTLTEWCTLIQEAGLTMHEVVKYDEEYEDCLIIAKLQ